MIIFRCSVKSALTFFEGDLFFTAGMPPQHLMRPPLMMPQPAGPVVLTPPGAIICSDAGSMTVVLEQLN